jgi:hypothetical protein
VSPTHSASVPGRSEPSDDQIALLNSIADSPRTLQDVRTAIRAVLATRSADRVVLRETFSDGYQLGFIAAKHPFHFPAEPDAWASRGDMRAKGHIRQFLPDDLATPASPPRHDDLGQLTADLIVEVNAFLAHMAERFRERTSRRLLGIRRYSLTRMQAMQQALATFEAMDEPFGHPAQAWDRAHAHELVDIELSYWER